MITVAICDDDAQQKKRTKQMAEAFLEAHLELSVKVTAFSSANELLNYHTENGGFDLYILDIVMPDMNGIELGMKLRKMNDEGQIIYLTTEAEYAVDSYNTNAFFYLLKPIDTEKFFNALKKVSVLLNEKNSKSITVKTHDGFIKLLCDDIIYAELSGRCIHYHLTNGNIIESMTLRITFAEAISPLLTYKCFVLCGASYALNLHHIISIGNDSIQFRTGVRILPPKKALPLVRSKWLDYWLEGGK